MERKLGLKERDDSQRQIQTEMEQRVIKTNRNSMRLELERVLSRPQPQPSDFRLPLKETRIGSEGVPPTIMTMPRTSHGIPLSPTGSINLMSFESEPTSPAAGASFSARRASIHMDNAFYDGREDDDKRRKTVMELKSVFSRRSTAEAPPNGVSFYENCYPSMSAEMGVRSGYPPRRKTSLVEPRQESDLELTASIDVRNVSAELSPVSTTVAAVSVSESSAEEPSLNNFDVETPSAMASVSSAANPQNVLSDNKGDESLKVSERVVWIIRRNRVENGILRWIGEIDGKLTAGVSFENPVGNTDGTLKGIRYFTCEKNYGGFLPIASLMKYDDFHCVKNTSRGDSKSSIYDSGTKSDDSKEYLSAEFSADGGISETNKILIDEEDNVIICAICQDPLLDVIIKSKEDVQMSQGDDGMVSTFCGHLFHAFCLNKWFHMKPFQPIQECPYCKKTMDINATIRIFPVLGKP